MKRKKKKNELKLSTASDKYTKITKQIIAKMNGIIVSRFTMINGSIEEVKIVENMKKIIVHWSKDWFI